MDSTYTKLINGRGEQIEAFIFEKGFPISLNLTEFLKFQLRYLIKGVKMSEGELTLLSYIFLYGESAVQKMLDDGYSKSKPSLTNYLGRLRKEGVLIEGNALHPSINLTTDPSEFIYYFILEQ